MTIRYKNSLSISISIQGEPPPKKENETPNELSTKLIASYKHYASEIIIVFIKVESHRNDTIKQTRAVRFLGEIWENERNNRIPVTYLQNFLGAQAFTPWCITFWLTRTYILDQFVSSSFGVKWHLPSRNGRGSSMVERHCFFV